MTDKITNRLIYCPTNLVQNYENHTINSQISDYS